MPFADTAQKVCNSPEEVADMIHRVFTDIREKKQLSDFSVAKEMHRGVGAGYR